MTASARPLPWSPAWLVALGNLLFKARDAVFPIVIVGLIALSRPAIGSVNRERWIDAIAVGVAIAGQALRVAVIGYRYIVRGGRNREVYAEGLVSTGFFALSRNPLYVGNILILLGLLLLWRTPLALAAGIPFFLLGYRAIVAAEEAYLGRQYGAEYADYCARVPRWWPRLGGVRAATAGMRFNWRRVILKEYGSAAYWMAGASLLLLLRERRYAALEGRSPGEAVWWSAIGVVFVGWAVARWLKKTRRLREAT